MSATAAKRKRTSKPRSKNGCGTCRTRHVKCDETRPVCLNCERLGVLCEGWIETVERPRPSPHRAAVLERLAIPVYLLPFALAGAPSQRKAFHYYMNSAVLSLSGNTNDVFWTEFLPRSCQHEPVLRQCLIALSCAHLEYCDSDLASANVSDALDHCSKETLEAYGRAIASLGRYVSRPLPERRTVLACILVLYTFERLRKNTHAAISHLDNGIRILEVGNAKQHSTELTPLNSDMELLRITFAQHDAGATMYDLQRMPELHTLSRDLHLPIDYAQSRSEALKALRDHMTSAIRHPLLVLISQTLGLRTRYYSHGRRLLAQQADRLRSRLQIWNEAAELYEYRHHSLAIPDEAAGCRDAISFYTMKVQHCSSQALLAENIALLGVCAVPQTLQQPWDQNHYKLLRYAKNCVALHHKLMTVATEARLKRTWCPDPGIAGPLLLLSKKTRNPDVGASATALLKELSMLNSADGSIGHEVSGHEGLSGFAEV